jgi:hypothetical protein
MLAGMTARSIGFLLLLLAGRALGAGDAALPAPVEYTVLPPGRYSIEIRGLRSTVCARAIAAEWAKLPEVESAAVDYEKEEAVVAVRLDKKLKVAALRKALRRAERTANLNAHYDMRLIRYIP